MTHLSAMPSTSNTMQTTRLIHSRKASAKHAQLHLDEDPELQDCVDPENGTQDEMLLLSRIKKNPGFIIYDCCLLFLYFLQMYCVLQSLALRWTWPKSWLMSTRYLFVFNLDVWEFYKLTNGTYKSTQGYYMPTSSIDIKYWYILLGWATFIILALAIYIIVYFVISHKNRPTMMLQQATLQRVYIVLALIFSLPFGITISRLFQCTDKNVMVVDNDIECFQSGHWVYIVPAFVMAFLYYCVFSYWLVTKTRSQMLNLSVDRHEGYLQLKEIEYLYGLDKLWIIGGFHIFASFKKWGAHFRSILHFSNGVILLICASLCNHMQLQAALILACLVILLIIFIIIRPFRVSCFNVMLFFTLLCLSLDCMMGCLRADDNYTSSVWMAGNYVNAILLIINIFWAIFALAFIIFLLCRQCIGFQCFWCTGPLWPSMTQSELDKLQPETQKFIKMILRGRILAERCMAVPAMFAPAHELGRYIHIVNAYCREAAYLHDPMTSSLWYLLDLLIETHSAIAPKSLFAESVKGSIRLTAKELMKMMPKFVKRLAQREYDFILVSPTKRRILLKLYCMGLFLNGRRQKLERDRITVPAIENVWPKKLGDNVEEFHDDGYYEDMYPPVKLRPVDNMVLRPFTSHDLDLDILGEEMVEDEVALAEAEEWTRQHPMSAGGHSNSGFEMDEVSEILKDDISVDFANMMEGVPSRPVTAETSGYPSRLEKKSNSMMNTEDRTPSARSNRSLSGRSTPSSPPAKNNETYNLSGDFDEDQGERKSSEI